MTHDLSDAMVAEYAEIGGHDIKALALEVQRWRSHSDEQLQRGYREGWTEAMDHVRKVVGP